MRIVPLVILLALSPVPAFAYIGPGAGISAIGTLVAVIGALLLAIVGFVWYPLKRLMKGRSAARAQDAGSDEEA